MSEASVPHPEFAPEPGPSEVSVEAPRPSTERLAVPFDPTTERFRLLARVVHVCNLGDFLRLDEGEAHPDTAVTARARFKRGLVALSRPSVAQDWTVTQVEHHAPGSRKPVLLDPHVLRIALAFRLQPFQAAYSVPSRSQWTFGTPGSEERNAAILMRGKPGKFSVTLRPGTNSSVILADREHGVSPIALCEKVFELIDVGGVRSFERGVVRCDDADILLSRPDEAPRGVWRPYAVRLAGSPPIPLEALQLAAELGFGAFIRFEPGKPVVFERGAIELSEKPLAVRRVSTRAGLVLVGSP